MVGDKGTAGKADLRELTLPYRLHIPPWTKDIHPPQSNGGLVRVLQEMLAHVGSEWLGYLHSKDKSQLL